MLVSPRERTQQAMALRASTPCSCSLGRLGSAMTQPVALPGSLPVATPSRLRPEASAASVLFWRNSNPVPPLVSSQAKLTPSWSAKALPAAQSACGSSNLAPAPTRDIIALEASAREARPSAGAQRRAGPRAQGGAAPSARSELPLSLRAANEEALQASRERQELFDSISPVYDLGSISTHTGTSSSGATVVGLDYARDQLAVARTKEKAAWRPWGAPVEWLWGDAQDLPFEDESVDAATMGYGLRNVTDMDLALRQIHRILKPGKSCAILDFNNSEDETVSSVQSFMLNNVVVPVASQFGVAAQYEYLEGSIQRFPRGRSLEQMAKRAGFSRAVHYETGFGLMGILVVNK